MACFNMYSKFLKTKTVLSIILLFCLGSVYSQGHRNDFESRSIRLNEGTTMMYRLFIPKNYDSDKKYPIVVSLHGVGERGTDNNRQIDLEDLIFPWILDSIQTRVPHFMMVPQCPPDLTWGGMGGGGSDLSPTAQGIVDVLEELGGEFSLDTNRFYITGLSMGAAGTYHLIEKRPGLFAAAVPCAAGGNTAAADIIAQTPWWAFHGSEDTFGGTDPGSRLMANAIENEGYDVVRFVSDVAIPAPSLSAYRDAIANGTDPVDLVAKDPSGISWDSLTNAVKGGADYLYSELTGGDHRSGWMIAWHNPLLAMWLFSKSKEEPEVSVKLNVNTENKNSWKLQISPANSFNNFDVFTLTGRQIKNNSILGRVPMVTLKKSTP